MIIYLFRHGIAEDHAADGTDASRALTGEGIEKTREAAAGLASLIEPPEAVLTSPKVRARQTAQIVGEALSRPPQVMDELAAGSASRVQQALARRTEEALVLVGHEPTLSQLVERICGGEERGFVEMKKAGCACVEFDPQNGGGRLLWLATPRMLRLMGA